MTPASRRDVTDTVLSWTMFGDCGEIQFEALRLGAGIQCRLSNEGALLSAEWVQDAAALLQRSAEIRWTLKHHGFRERAARTPALHGGLSWGPALPSTTILSCMQRVSPPEPTYRLDLAAIENRLSR